MARKKWTAQTETTTSLMLLRGKRRWQIALRRYILERKLCPYYAPFFGIDIHNFRDWIEIQFNIDQSWDNFSIEWHFDHVVPIAHFDFSKESEMRLCWNFTNIRIARLDKGRGIKPDIIVAKGYFEELYKKTGFATCLWLLDKINKIELSEIFDTGMQEAFILNKKAYLDVISLCSTSEFELLNSGKQHNEVLKKLLFKKMTFSR